MKMKDADISQKSSQLIHGGVTRNDDVCTGPTPTMGFDCTEANTTLAADNCVTTIEFDHQNPVGPVYLIRRAVL
jgi:hypothetical protein